MSRINTIIRSDASTYIGSGHIMRCLVLAEALIKHGHDVIFACRVQEGDLIDYIESKGIKVFCLKKLHQQLIPKHSADYQAWLQVSWQEDAQEFIELVADADLVITDHYAIDSLWQGLVKTSLKCKILAIDDLNRTHNCELIVDQNLWPNMAARYQHSSGCKLLGPSYALLKPSFSELRDQVISSKNQVLAFFGGSDLTKECLKLLKAALNEPSLPFHLKIVAGRSNKSYQALVSMSVSTNISVEKFIDNFDLELKQSNYVIGASGVSNWERFCLGIPSSIVSVADNQRILSQYLSDIGSVRYLGDSDDTDISSYTHELRYLASGWPNIKPLNPVLVDGLGVSRIIKKIEEVLAK
ncbi:UDP-2,4-diacetamido-2,4,6-trideoxy-beta-L-altropyranose hydrolase [uncultured Psychromonas sp.]|uniref:UDP-2,4-diacetamido-2,4, 6-trideoxy-beta-L-altropyranose hydrolase n=1 Tax=uncultured Psychromonas sp. TaxID=173974 RepID=UPI00260164F2|nr:UDP-2,4-diacetamido-2,4,6-trideoxy-beta-L-altropyranose hydrolase [uncultured Psychromonas sp.]